MTSKNYSKFRLALEVVEKVNLFRNRNDANALIDRTLHEKNRPVVLSFINAHACNICCRDTNFSTALLKSDLIFKDGIGMQLLYQKLGTDPGVDLNGTDFIPELLHRFKGRRVALLGTKQPYLQAANDNLLSMGHTTVLVEDGFQPLEHYVKLVEQARPEIIILGMGMPKQEKLSVLLKETVSYSCLVINGGAILDFLGNKIHRAPMWLRKVKLEWLFRLAQEPRRLFSRYIIGNFMFFLRGYELNKIYKSDAGAAITQLYRLNVKDQGLRNYEQN